MFSKDFVKFLEKISGTFKNYTINKKSAMQAWKLVLISIQSGDGAQAVNNFTFLASD